MVIFYKIYVSCLTHGSATSLLTTHSLHIFYIFSSISELNFIYKMCTWRVVPVCGLECLHKTKYVLIATRYQGRRRKKGALFITIFFPSEHLNTLVTDSGVRFFAQIGERNHSLVYYKDRLNFEDAQEHCDSVGLQLFLSDDPEIRSAV